MEVSPCFLFIDVIQLFHYIQKVLYPLSRFFTYEYELSTHLNTAYISFAPVRVLRAGAFLLFLLFFFEKRNKQPSPTWIRSERGREDKPKTSVLYSTRGGGELYGAIFFR